MEPKASEKIELSRKALRAFADEYLVENGRVYRRASLPGARPDLRLIVERMRESAVPGSRLELPRPGGGLWARLRAWWS